MGRKDSNEPDRATLRRRSRRLALPAAKREEIERALKQRIRGVLVSTMRAGADLYSPTEMITFIGGEVDDLRSAAEGRENRTAKPLTEIRVVMEQPPGPTSQFVEVEDTRGRSVGIGEWVERPDGLWALVIKSKGFVQP